MCFAVTIPQCVRSDIITLTSHRPQSGVQDSCSSRNRLQRTKASMKVFGRSVLRMASLSHRASSCGEDTASPELGISGAEHSHSCDTLSLNWSSVPETRNCNSRPASEVGVRDLPGVSGLDARGRLGKGAVRAGARAADRQWWRRWRRVDETRRRCSPNNPRRRPPAARTRSRAARSGGMPGTKTKSRSW